MTGRAITVAELAKIVGAAVHGNRDVIITGVASIEEAQPGDVTFVRDRKYLKHLARCNASAVVMSSEFSEKAPRDFTLLICDNPALAFMKIMELFQDLPEFPPQMHPTSVVSESAFIHHTAHIGPFVFVGNDSSIGANTVVMGHVYIGNRVKIGENCLIYPGVIILDRCVIGNRVTVHAGTVIGSDGFGYITDSNGKHFKIPQLGNVIIEDKVEIGANCAIDRATLGSTIVGRGTKIDNLVQIGHNVRIGRRCIMAGQVGVAGSVDIGDYVIMAGQVGVADHVSIGKGVRVGAKSGVASSIPPETDVVGIPAAPKIEYMRHYLNLKKLGKMKEELKELRKELKKLKEQVKK